MNTRWKIGLLTLAGCCTINGIAALHDSETRRMRKIQELRTSALESRASDKTVRDGTSATSRIERATDADIKSTLISATAPVCDYEVARRCYNLAVASCGGDNDRFSRIAVEIAKERPDRITWAIMELSSRGSIKHLPFLYDFTNNNQYAARAASSIVSIEGITSNSIAVVDKVMGMKLKDDHDRYVLCAALARTAAAERINPLRKNLAIAALKKYSKEVPSTSLWADEFLLSLDPAYETSEDRTALLREVAARRLNDYQVEYATNALEKIMVLCRAQKERLQTLENICIYVPSDDLEVEETIPTPDYIIRKYNVTTNDVLRDLWTLSAKYSLSETNEEKRLARDIAFMWIGHYGSTNDLAQLATVMTNSADYAQENALFASFQILEHSPALIPLVRGVVTNSCVYSSGLRGRIYIRLLDICTENYTEMYINDPAQQARIATFFLERAAVEQDDPLFIDRCAYTLNPSYRHSQQRRDNLAALRPPGLTGKPAELYDARQADAAQGD